MRPALPGVLALHAHRGSALLEITSLIDHQHHLLIVQLLDDEAADIVTNRAPVLLVAEAGALRVLRLRSGSVRSGTGMSRRCSSWTRRPLRA